MEATYDVEASIRRIGKYSKPIYAKNSELFPFSSRSPLRVGCLRGP